jgi:hypothetical protein
MDPLRWRSKLNHNYGMNNNKSINQSMKDKERKGIKEIDEDGCD